MFLFKACPKCGGDIYLELDEYDSFDLLCFQCSYCLRGKERSAALRRLRRTLATAVNDRWGIPSTNTQQKLSQPDVAIERHRG